MFSSYFDFQKLLSVQCNVKSLSKRCWMMDSAMFLTFGVKLDVDKLFCENHESSS